MTLGSVMRRRACTFYDSFERSLGASDEIDRRISRMPRIGRYSVFFEKSPRNVGDQEKTPWTAGQGRQSRSRIALVVGWDEAAGAASLHVRTCAATFRLFGPEDT